MFYYVYAIYSKSQDIIYVGQTKSIENRIKSHLKGQSTFTSRAKDWKLFYTESKETRTEALKREKQ
jgi:putative endonuclease